MAGEIDMDAQNDAQPSRSHKKTIREKWAEPWSVSLSLWMFALAIILMIVGGIAHRPLS